MSSNGAAFAGRALADDDVHKAASLQHLVMLNACLVSVMHSHSTVPNDAVISSHSGLNLAGKKSHALLIDFSQCVAFQSSYSAY